jgi:hypothetical protein
MQFALRTQKEFARLLARILPESKDKDACFPAGGGVCNFPAANVNGWRQNRFAKYILTKG